MLVVSYCITGSIALLISIPAGHASQRSARARSELSYRRSWRALLRHGRFYLPNQLEGQDEAASEAVELGLHKGWQCASSPVRRSATSHSHERRDGLPRCPVWVAMLRFCSRCGASPGRGAPIPGAAFLHPPPPWSAPAPCCRRAGRRLSSLLAQVACLRRRRE
jgi:hypothetical protein